MADDVRPRGEVAVIRRTPSGWHVDAAGTSQPADDLTSAMALADLLCGDVGSGARPPRVDDSGDDLERLRLSVAQLQHALAARVVIEQAIGVLAERQGVEPRVAFEKLRKVSRARGRRVHDLAHEVVASVTDHAVPLPPELSGRRPL